MTKGHFKRLEVVNYRGKEYTVDLRLKQFRNIKEMEFIPFNRGLGSRLYKIYEKKYVYQTIEFKKGELVFYISFIKRYWGIK